MLIDALYSLLSTVCADTYPGVTEQEVDPPFIVHALVRTVPHASKDGESSTDYKVIKVASYDDTQTKAYTLASAVRVKLDEYSGVLNSVDITKIRFTDEEDGYDQTTDLYYVLQTYRIWINFNT